MNNYEQLITLVKDAGILASVGEVLEWDEEVVMPPAAIDQRALQKGMIAAISHRLFTTPEIGRLIREVKQQKLTDEQQAMVREIEFDYQRATKVPETLVKEQEEVTTIAQEKWKQARADNNFTAFAPHLNKIIELKKQEAAAIDPTRNPYEVLVEEYESGIPIDEIRSIFSTIKEGLVPLITKISKAPKIDASFLQRNIPIAAQKRFSKFLARYISYDFTKGRLDESTHPFTSCYGRITTRYTDGFTGTIGSTIHEAGHGKYEHGLPFEHFGTPFGESRSLSIHESQSRFWENQVGKSFAFWKGLFPRLKKAYKLQDIDQETFYKAINIVQPGLIRVNADEVTYTMHIILRFEIEEALISGKLSVNELSKVWNKKMKDYLGIDVPDDTHGVLQDIHWSAGLIGYFPTYTLGSMIATQLFEAATRDIAGLEEKMAFGDFQQLYAWMHDKIYQHGRRYTTKELIKLATGEEPNSRTYLAYLEKKFGEIYNI